MIINNDLIEYLENLSRLSLNKDEKIHAMEDLTKILNYMERLSELSFDSSKMADNKTCADSKENLREDTVIDSFDRALLLSNASIKNSEYFIAPKTVEI